MCAGEKPFESVEDLVQDGLITLYMEANHVEEYLQSARQTRIVQRSSSIQSATEPFDLTPVQEDPTHMGEEPVFNGEVAEEVGGGVEMGEVRLQRAGARRIAYQPCTIPQRRDCTNIPHPEGEGEEEGPPAPTAEVSQQVLRYPACNCVCACVDVQGEKDKLRKRSTMHYQYEKPHNFKV